MKLLLGAVTFMILLGAGAVYWLEHRGQEVETTLAGHLTDLDTQQATARARAERDYRAAKEDAASLLATDRRQAELTKLAEHRYRLGSIDRLSEMLRIGYRQDEINDATAEFQRVLNDPTEQGGIDAAISYLHGKEAALLARPAAGSSGATRKSAAPTRRCAACWSRPSTAATEARPTEAERLFDQVLETDPDWPEALMAAGWLYRDRALFEDRYGTLAAVLPLARKALNSLTG